MTTSDKQDADVAVVIVAAGEGRRLGPGPAKALRPLGGLPMVVHALRRAVAADRVGHVVVASPPDAVVAVRDLIRNELSAAGAFPVPPVRVVAGGPDRRRSVAAALAAVPSDLDIVLVHDAARPLTPTGLVERVAAAVRGGDDAVVPVLPVTDTITRVDGTGASLGHLERSTLRAVQTPQAFRRTVLARAHATAGDVDVTDDAGLVARTGVPVRTVPGSPWAMKITTGLDLMIAEALLASADEDPPAVGDHPCRPREWTGPG